MNSLNKSTILIVEDEPAFRRIYHDIFTHAGFVVIEAEDGETGWIKAHDYHPDIIILDMIMPKMNGIEVLEKIRSDETIKNTLVVFFSVLGRDEEVRKGLHAGADGYIVKGFYPPKTVLEKITELLTRGKSTLGLAS